MYNPPQQPLDCVEGRYSSSESTDYPNVSSAYIQSNDSNSAFEDPSVSLQHENEEFKEYIADLSDELDTTKRELRQLSIFLTHLDSTSTAELTHLQSVVNKLEVELSLAQEVNKYLVHKLETLMTLSEGDTRKIEVESNALGFMDTCEMDGEGLLEGKHKVFGMERHQSLFSALDE